MLPNDSHHPGCLMISRAFIFASAAAIEDHSEGRRPCGLNGIRSCARSKDQRRYVHSGTAPHRGRGIGQRIRHGVREDSLRTFSKADQLFNIGCGSSHRNEKKWIRTPDGTGQEKWEIITSRQHQLQFSSTEGTFREDLATSAASRLS